jgi:aryl-alcohol dehydrogenase-like predicted oxidoreductase
MGTVQMGLPYGVNNSIGRIPIKDSHTILAEAYRAGIRFLDTAEVYGDAHQVIGEFHRANSLQRFNVITKIPSIEGKVDLEIVVRKYLADLQIDQLEALMFHSFISYRKNSNLLPEFIALKQRGLFRQIGVSIYTNKELEALIEDSNVDLIQIPFNLLDNASIKGDLLQHARSEGKTIHGRSAFLQGLFFKSPLDNHMSVKPLREALTRIHEIAVQNRLSITELALGYCLQQQDVDKVLIGVDSPEQLKVNLAVESSKVEQRIVDEVNRIHVADVNLLNPSLWNLKK